MKEKILMRQQKQLNQTDQKKRKKERKKMKTSQLTFVNLTGLSNCCCFVDVLLFVCVFEVLYNLPREWKERQILLIGQRFYYYY